MTNTDKKVDAPNPASKNESELTILDKAKAFVGGWKFKVSAILSLLVGLGLVVFFWQHIIATIGMKAWSSRSGAQPIECMIRDTNTDHYVSCSAKLDGQIVPLECGADILNIGCRVNYGAAASPGVRR
ncbi:MAG: hypothetical protein HC796_06135 [Synechococcaceae cyanobacterium RL_1_2]|nr:hypothetical protein [Synechococcaceae cyanobacterium RL_1_2]